MNALARLESFLQNLVERPAALLGPRRVHPIELAQALTRALESSALPLADRVLAPDTYTLRLNPEDYAQLAGVRRTLEREYAGYLERLAQERDLALSGAVHVAIIVAGAVRLGTVEVSAVFTEESAPPAQLAGATIAGRIEPPSDAPDATEVIVRRVAPPVAAQAVLELLDDRGRVSRAFPLNGESAVIGRRTANDVTLADSEVSRRHARIERTRSGYAIEDLGSMNGTIVNGRRIPGPQMLADGDRIELGQSHLRFRLVAQAAERAGG